MIKNKAFLTLLIIITLVSCETKKNSQTVKIQLYDKLQNSDSVKVITYDMLDYSENILLSESISSLKGKSFEIALTRPVFANLKVDEAFHQAYLEPGFDMKLYTEYQDGTIYLKYSGDGSVTNNYLEQSSRIMNEFYKTNPNWFRMNQMEFSNALDSLQYNLNSHLASVALSPETLKTIETKNELTLINLRQQHRLVNNEAYSIETLNFSMGSSDNIPFDNKLLELSLLEYAQVLDLFLRSKIQEPMFEGRNADELDSIKDYFPVATSQLIKQRTFPTDISEFLRAKNISYWLESEGLSEGFEAVYNEFRNDFEDSNYMEQLEKKYNEWLQIGKGQPSREITGLTLDNDTISLSDLKGKVVYIDVWATWCAPCIKEFPYYEELEKKLGERDDIEFLFVSIDNQRESWVSYLKEKATPKGIHLREQLGFGHPSVQESYNMWGVPRYILIDQNGKIVNSNAPRPSSSRVSELINSL